MESNNYVFYFKYIERKLIMTTKFKDVCVQGAQKGEYKNWRWWK